MSDNYDLIVVGAGSGGSVVAARASEDPRIRVLLIESGPDYPNVEALPEDLRNVNHGSFFDHDWKLRYTPSSDEPPDAPLRARARHRRLVGREHRDRAARHARRTTTSGPRSATRRGAGRRCCRRSSGSRRDLDFGDGPYHGKSGPLPIRRHTREELVPYQAAFLDACAELGYPACRDHNDPETTGYGPHPMNKRGTLRISTAIAYLGPARDRPNLTILADTDVRARRVRRRRRRGRRGAHGGWRATTITRAAGRARRAARSTRRRCSCAPASAPRDVLDRLGHRRRTPSRAGVGQNLQDHPAIGPTLVPKEGVANFDQPVIQTTLRYTATGSGDVNDMQLEPLSFMHIPGAGALLMGLAACVFKSYSFGRLEFESADVDARPRIVMDYLVGRARLRQDSRRPGPRRWSLRHEGDRGGDRRRAAPDRRRAGRAAALEPWIRRNSSTGAHPSCTARMGAGDDPTAVCDERGLVHGVRGLRIADASLMPRVPSANTNVPTIMIGERIAEFARRTWDSGCRKREHEGRQSGVWVAETPAGRASRREKREKHL